jgi:hypothetical protein
VFDAKTSDAAIAGPLNTPKSILPEQPTLVRLASTSNALKMGRNVLRDMSETVADIEAWKLLMLNSAPG